jgi:hypothetical protein
LRAEESTQITLLALLSLSPDHFVNDQGRGSRQFSEKAAKFVKLPTTNTDHWQKG